MQAVDDFFRRATRCQHAVPVVDGEARHTGLGHRRQIRKVINALGRSHRQRAYAVGLDLRQRRRHRGKNQLQIATDEINHGRRTALVRHMRHLHTSHRIKKFTGQMIGGTNPRRTEIQLARIRLRIRDQVLHGMHRQRRVNYQHIERRHTARHRLEAIDRIVG